jgi:recombination protein U
MKVKCVNYPNKIKKEYNKPINYANRGMDLESIINDTNNYLLDKDIAIIYKKPTPIGIVDTCFKNNKKIITKAYFASPSTLDYNGLYKGKYIEFDAKSTENKTSFPLSNIHEHQILHIKNIIKHQGIVFLIIQMNNNFYLLNGIDLIDFINNNDRKSIPFNYIKEKGYLLEYNYNKGLNYLKYVDIIGGFKDEEI